MLARGHARGNHDHDGRGDFDHERASGGIHHHHGRGSHDHHRGHDDNGSGGGRFVFLGTGRYRRSGAHCLRFGGPVPRCRSSRCGLVCLPVGCNLRHGVASCLISPSPTSLCSPSSEGGNTSKRSWADDRCRTGRVRPCRRVHPGPGHRPIREVNIHVRRTIAGMGPGFAPVPIAINANGRR